LLPGDGSIFQVDPRAGRIVFDNGVYRAFCGADGANRVRFEKRSGRFVGMCTADVDLSARKLLGAVFDQNGEIFCYTVEPGRWVVSRPLVDIPAQINTRAADQIVSIRPRDVGFEVRIWSDARYGGDGSVRLEQHRDSEVVSSRTRFSFDQLGGGVAKYQFVQDGSGWATIVDEAGEPISLVRCRRGKKSGEVVFATHGLEGLQAGAQRLEAGVAFD
jgi:hypothetical protein